MPYSAISGMVRGLMGREGAHMSDNLAELQNLVLKHCTRSTVTTAIPELTLYRAEAVSEPIPFVFEPRVYVIVQGSKQVMLRDRVFDYDASHYLVTAVDLPVAGCITQASPEHPYLALCLALDPVQIAELLLVVNEQQVDPNQACIMGMGLSPLNAGIIDPLLRLMKLLDQPEDIPILKPLIVRELLYRLLQGDQGCALRQIATAGSTLSQINRAIHWISQHYVESFDISRAASVAGMGLSTFHRHFRVATNMSPLQYRTQLRLQEARRRMVSENVDAAEAAFAVGYESPSQFSREYRRMFGRPPAKDALCVRADQLSERNSARPLYVHQTHCD
ncbi:AraC family transcriptional regulator [Acetobacter syzygii]|uniref:AraC family transcriptional regulator n=1 Tax=Acetobacter syzygii TaxID=146476 RepID=UPI0005DA8573|nr:AraC family transcriptional regulator [Acetobacter syzygii]GAN70475.1 transcriptional regulator AraC [Acetobacter syzygii]GEL56915.1 AraC family transcriptional regulator [Acetobacter syzygii]